MDKFGLGVATLWLSVIVLLPLAALTTEAFSVNGLQGFIDAVSSPGAIDALRVTIGASAVVALINVVFGTLIAWGLVRDEFPGKGIVNALIDLPFALPTIVASLVLLSIYGPDSPVGSTLNATQPALVLALSFVTLPFVVRAVQPVLIEVDGEVEEAAATLGASPWQIFSRITLPAIRWALTYGIVLTVARALGEFGAVIMVASNFAGGGQTLTLLVHSRYIDDHNEFGAYAAATLLMAVSVAVLILMTTIQKRSRIEQ